MTRLLWIILVDAKYHPKSLKEKGRGKSETQRRRKLRIVAKITVMWPKAKECWQPPEAGRDRAQILSALTPSEGMQPC